MVWNSWCVFGLFLVFWKNSTYFVTEERYLTQSNAIMRMTQHWQDEIISAILYSSTLSTNQSGAWKTDDIK